MNKIAKEDFKTIIEIRNNLYQKDILMAIANMTNLLSRIENTYEIN